MSKRKQTWDNYKEKVAKRNDKRAAAAAGGSDGITILRGCLARWKANARSTRESGHWLWFLSIKSHHSRTLKKHASCILTRIWCKMGLTGLHDSPARVLNILFIVWLSRVCLWATALFCKIRGAIFCSLRSVMVLFLLNASFSWEFALG